MSKEKSDEKVEKIEEVEVLETTSENLIVVDIENSCKFSLKKDKPLNIEEICKEVDKITLSNKIYILNSGQYLLAKKHKGIWNVEKTPKEYIKTLMIGGTIVNIVNIKEKNV